MPHPHHGKIARLPHRLSHSTRADPLFWGVTKPLPNDCGSVQTGIFGLDLSAGRFTMTPCSAIEMASTPPAALFDCKMSRRLAYWLAGCAASGARELKFE